MEPVAPVGARTTPLDPRFANPAWRSDRPDPRFAHPAGRPNPPARPTTSTVTVATRRGARTITVEGNATWSALNAAISAFDDGVERDPVTGARVDPATGVPEVPGLSAPEEVAEPVVFGGTKTARGARGRFLQRSIQLLEGRRTRLWVTHEKMFRWFNGLSMALQGAKDALRRATMVKGGDPGHIQRLTDKVKQLETQLANLGREMTDVAAEMGSLSSMIDGMISELSQLGDF